MSLKRTTAFIALFLAFCPFPASAQKHKFIHYGMENGMSSNTIFKILQDKDGLMWFGTNDGLTRFDGTTLKTWRNTPSDSRSLGNNSIYSLKEDRDGTLYIGTENGLYAFDKNEELFTEILTTKSLPEAEMNSLSNILVRSLDLDKKNRLWIATLGQGLLRYDIETGRLVRFSKGKDNKYGIDSDYITSVLCDERGRTWCTNASQNIYLYDDDKNMFSRIHIYDERAKAEGNAAFSLCEDYQGNIWIGGWGNGLFRYDKTSGSFTNYRLTSDNGSKLYTGRIHTVTEVEPGIISYGCDNGIVNFDTRTGRCENIRYEPNTNRSITDNFIYDIVKDQEGGIWVATYFGGVNYTNKSSSLFNFSMTDTTGKKGRVISKFCEDPGKKLWIGTDDGGLFLYDMASEICKEKIVDRNIPNLNIHALLKDGDGLWVGTYSKGLYYLDTKSGETKHWPKFNSDKDGTDASVYALFKDINGRLWIGTKTGITIKEGDDFRETLDLGFNSDVIDIRGDIQGNIWIASISSGLMKYSPKTGTIGKPSTKGVIPDKILAIEIVRDIIWIGTAGNGLIRYDTNTGIITPISSKDILSSDQTVYNIISENDNLWVSSNSGLVRYNTQTQKAKLFGTGDGLSANALNYNSGVLTSDGVVFLGTNGGFNYFRPDEIPTNSIAPRLYLSDVDYSESETEARGLLAEARKTGQMHIRTGHKPLRLTFSVLSYIAPHKNRYKWKIDDGEWNEYDYRGNEIILTGLKRGEHTILVSGCNNDGVWSAEIPTVVKVKPYFYNSTGAIIVYSIILLSLVLLFARILWVYQKERKANKAERIRRDRDRVRLETELELFTDIAKGIRTPVMLINGPVDEILAEKGLSDRARKNAAIIKNSSDKLHVITHEILDFLHNSIESLRSDVGDVSMPMKGEYRNIAAEIEKTAKKSAADTVLQDTNTVKRREISIMIIDPDAQMREFLSLALSRHYQDIHTEENAEKAKQTLDNGERIDLIISDAAVGIDLCGELRNEERFCHIPVILLSSSDNLSLKVSGIGKGADIFLEKPVEIEYLITRINGILDKRKMIWDSFSKRPYAPLRSTVQGKGDEQFLQQISEIVSVRFTDMDFSVDDLAEQMHLSRSVLFERTKEACGMTPNNFIKEMRLRKAASLLAEQKYKVNEICYMVGFNTPSYFAKCFFRQFGVLPKDFVG